MYALIAKHILGPLLDFSRGSEIRKGMKELNRTQWLSRDSILELQNRRLRQLIRHAYENVPYYRKVLDERGLRPNDLKTAADLALVPVLTKQHIRENFDQLIAHGFPRAEMVMTRTGGSTGKPLEFYTSKDERFNWSYAKVRRALSWWGYEVGDRFAQIQLSNPQRSKLVMLRRRLERIKTFVTWEAAAELPLFANSLEAFRPEFISGYPSLIHLLASFLEKQGRNSLRLRGIITHSEQLYDFQRELFMRVFGCPCYSSYESWEMNQIGAECGEQSGYHIAAETLIVEVSGERGEVLPVGQEGKILNTNLCNYAMPFIRYDTGDVGAVTDEICPCGRGLPLIKKLSGRTSDFLLTTSGNRIPGLTLDLKLFATEEVSQFQIIQEKRDEVKVKIVPSAEGKRKDISGLKRKIRENYKAKLGEDMDIKIELVDNIPTTQTGKRRVVVSKLPDMNQDLSTAAC